MTNFQLIQNDNLSIIKKELDFFIDSQYYKELDEDEKQMTGLVIAKISNMLNENSELRNNKLEKILTTFEKICELDSSFENYVVTEFLENIRFEISNINDFPIIAELQSKYM